jgi:hypothetical protein
VLKSGSQIFGLALLAIYLAKGGHDTVFSHVHAAPMHLPAGMLSMTDDKPKQPELPTPKRGAIPTPREEIEKAPKYKPDPEQSQEQPHKGAEDHK